MAYVADSLNSRLAQCFPRGTRFKYYHLSTSPSICDALFTPPPRVKPEKTYCESHFFIITIYPSASDDKDEVVVYGIEVLIYTTLTLTTIFVSKADSTGYVSRLNLPQGFPSPLRPLTTAIISWLVRHRHRPDRKLTVSLFARAQNQYLFPGSSTNPKKHVLDDRGLVKWWCKTLDPVLREYRDPDSAGIEPKSLANEEQQGPQITSKAYLVVPGHDRYETRAFMPPSAQLDPSDQKRWINDHPLRQISATPGPVPPRCLVPRFPDDPKSRFLLDLDAEIPDVPLSQREGVGLDSPSKRGMGQWKSVRTLEQFWDLMAFRQECSSGRLVGFIWIVFTPSELPDDYNNVNDPSPSPSPSSSQKRPKPLRVAARKKALSIKKRNPRIKKLKGIVHPRAPRVKSVPLDDKKMAPISKHYHSPSTQVGDLVLTSKAYSRMTEILRRLDFSDMNIALISTSKWIQETAVIASAKQKDWGVAVIGERDVPQNAAVETVIPAMSSDNVPKTINILSAKKRKVEEVGTDDKDIKLEQGGALNVQTLSSNLVRKKPKIEDKLPPQRSIEPGVNTLGSHLVRKKAK